MVKSFTKFKKLEPKKKKKKQEWKLKIGYKVCKKNKIKYCDYLNWQPTINVFKVERSLIFAECKSIICVKMLQFFLTAHNEYLNDMF